MNTSADLFHLYVRTVGGRAEAAKRLGISVGMVGHLLCGRRTVSPKLARAIEADSDGLFKRELLRPDVFGDH